MPKGSRRAGRLGAALAASVVAAALLPTGAQAVTFPVDTTAGTFDGTCGGANCTFRDAVDDANGTPGVDTINFAPGGQGTITLALQVDVTDSVTISGGGVVDIQGDGTANQHGLRFTGAQTSTVTGLSVTGWNIGGVDVRSGATVTVQGSRLGVNVDGSPDGNGDGVHVASTAGGATIGGAGGGEGNVISANTFDGIFLEGGSTPVAIHGNRIGTNVAGTAALGTQPNGIVVNGTGRTIGGAGAGQSNLISGNTTSGIFIDAASGNAIQGNVIGLSANGTAAISNSTGVFADQNSSGNIVGGSGAGQGNTISGNTIGVSVAGDDTRLEGNSLVSNTVLGVSVNASGERTTIGGSASGAGNVLSANSAGIQTDGPNTKIFGNYIGLAADGLAPFGNSTSGIIVQRTANNTDVGGPNPGEGNLIGSNGAAGVVIRNGASGVRVRGNGIGVNKNGEPRRNLTAGVRIFDAANNSVGGTTAAEANTIAFNAGQGVNINRIGPGDPAFEEPVGNQVLINSIHTNGALGIDLSADIFGRTVNDPGDGDTGANTLQNFPVLASAYDDGGSTAITGSLNSTPGATFKVRFFSNPAGTDQAETFIGEQDVTTDGAGNAGVGLTANPAIPLGRTVTATATDAAGNTSEISDPATVQTRPVPGPPPDGRGPAPVDPRLGVLGFRTASFKSSKTKVTFKVTNRVTYPISITVTGREGKVGKTKAPAFKTVKTSVKAGQTKTITLAIPSTQRKAIVRELKKRKKVVRRLSLRITNTTGVVSRAYKPRLTVKR